MTPHLTPDSPIPSSISLTMFSAICMIVVMCHKPCLHYNRFSLVSGACHVITTATKVGLSEAWPAYFVLPRYILPQKNGTSYRRVLCQSIPFRTRFNICKCKRGYRPHPLWGTDQCSYHAIFFTYQCKQTGHESKMHVSLIDTSCAVSSFTSSVRKASM